MYSTGVSTWAAIARPPVLATCSAAGEPNLTYLSSAQVLDDDHVVLSNQFFGKTVANLERTAGLRARPGRRDRSHVPHPDAIRTA